MSLTLQHISNFSSVPTVFRRFFTWFALSDVDLCFSFTLVRKASAFEEEFNEPRDYTIIVIDPCRGSVRNTRDLGPTMTAQGQSISISIGMLTQTLIMSRLDQLS